MLRYTLVKENSDDITLPEQENTKEDINTPKRDILADYEEDEKEETQKNNTLSFLDDTESQHDVEEIYLPEQEANLENLFKDDEDNQNTINQLMKENGNIIVEEVKPTNVSEIIHHSETPKTGTEQKSEPPVDENTYTDHAIRRSVINRQQHVRNPLTTFRKDEEYSDFLKKTKSLFYRIKWSLFKD